MGRVNVGDLIENEQTGRTRATWVVVSNEESEGGETGENNEQILTSPNAENGQKQHSIGSRPSV